MEPVGDPPHRVAALPFYRLVLPYGDVIGEPDAHVILRRGGEAAEGEARAADGEGADLLGDEAIAVGRVGDTAVGLAFDRDARDARHDGAVVGGNDAAGVAAVESIGASLD